MRHRRENPVVTWEGMKEKLMLKYVSPSFSQQLLDKWNRWIHENKSATDYITKFDEYLNRCGAIELESPEQTLSTFRSGLRDDYRWELIARGITTLEEAYQLVTDLDKSRGSYFHRTDFRNNSKTATSSKPNFSRSLPAPSKPASSSSSVKPVVPSGANQPPSRGERLVNQERSTQGPNAMVSRVWTSCRQCPSQTKNLFVKVSIEDMEEKDDGEVVVH